MIRSIDFNDMHSFMDNDGRKERQKEKEEKCGKMRKNNENKKKIIKNNENKSQ